MKIKTTAILLTTLMISTLAGCGAGSSNASETGASSMESVNSGNEVLAEAGIADASSDTDNTITISKSSEAVSGDLKEYQFMYDGNVISAMDDFETLDKAFGGSAPADSSLQAMHTYGNNAETVIMTRLDDGPEVPITVGTSNASVVTARNIKIGSSKDDVIAAYGEAKAKIPEVTKSDGTTMTDEEYIEKYGEDLFYTIDDCEIEFNIKDGKVAYIQFKNMVNYDKYSWD